MNTESSSNSPPPGDNRTLDNFIKDAITLLSPPLSNIHSRRALLYKWSEDICSRQKSKTNRFVGYQDQFWTVEAYKKYRDNCEMKKKGMKINKYLGLHFEHPVPRGVITNWLCPKGSLPNEAISKFHVERAIRLFLVTCWVTEDEEKLLNSGTYENSTSRVKESMPESWDPQIGDEWARYEWVQKKYMGNKEHLSDWKKESEFVMPMSQLPVS